MFLNLKRS